MSEKSNDQKGFIELIDLPGEESEKRLSFSLNPYSFKVSKNFEYDISPLLKKTTSVVTYSKTLPSYLQVSLIYNDDLSFSKNTCVEVLNFLEKFSIFVEEKQSISRVKFRLGNFDFDGYLIGYQYSPKNFGGETGSEITGLELGLDIISLGVK